MSECVGPGNTSMEAGVAFQTTASSRHDVAWRSGSAGWELETVTSSDEYKVDHDDLVPVLVLPGRPGETV